MKTVHFVSEGTNVDLICPPSININVNLDCNLTVIQSRISTLQVNFSDGDSRNVDLRQGKSRF
jgi:hypothetical protein